MTYNDNLSRNDLIRALETRNAEIERLSLDLHDARNQLQAAWAQQDAIGAGGVDQKPHAAANTCGGCCYKIAYNEWSEKTSWIRNKLPGKFIGMHLADAMSRYIEDLEAEVKAHQEINDSFLEVAASAEPVAYRLLRKNAYGEWVTDGRPWCDGVPDTDLVKGSENSGRYRIEYAFATPVAVQPQPSSELPQVALPPKPTPLYEVGDYSPHGRVSYDCYDRAEILVYGRACAEAQRIADSAALAVQTGEQYKRAAQVAGVANGANGLEPSGQAQQGREGAFCTWHNDPETDNSWDTGCRQLFELYDGTPSENRMNFCCYCGKPILEVGSE